MGVATNLTSIEMSEILSELHAALGRPFKVEADDHVRAFHLTLANFPTDVVRQAARAWYGKETKMPAPAQLKGACFDVLAAARRDRQHARDDAHPSGALRCPRCRCIPWFAGFELRPGVVHGMARCACPEVSERWRTPAALDWRETTPGMPHAPDAWDATTETLRTPMRMIR